jgi:3-hydroxyacyl-CoA dehydrogenase
MGSRIAAHFANAGIPSMLLDLASPQSPDRSALARSGIAAALKQKPGAFFTTAAADLIEPGNFDDDLSRINDCDWVIEAVSENLAVKRALWIRVNEFRASHAILSTNTSGILISEISRGFPDNFQRKFLGTHFFNPPRYLHLLELIPGPLTDSQIVEFVSEFADAVLGKGVVPCKDTPNFIANRLGSFFGAAVLRAMMEGDYTIEEADLLTGPLIGLPKSATFRLIDLIGLDVWEALSRNLFEAAIQDEWRSWFAPSPVVEQMTERGWLGEKCGQGFYRRVGPDKRIEALDWSTLEYRPATKPGFESVDRFRRTTDLGERIRDLCWTKDRAGSFVWSIVKNYLAYSAARVGDISNRVVEIDRAMRWGYGHKLGPFELWDALGFEAAARRMESEGVKVPRIAQLMLDKEISSFYRSPVDTQEPGTEYFDQSRGRYVNLENRSGVISIAQLKGAKEIVESNTAASLLDLGDGVLCLEFHSKMNAVSEDTLDMIDRAIATLPISFESMVIANEGENFSVGADLAFILSAARAADFATLEAFIRHFQQCMLKIKYAPKPVVAAVFSRALGGGCEIVLQSHRIQASAESYVGLVEAAIGLIPAAGGTKEMAMRFSDPLSGFEVISHSKVSGSATEARELGFLRVNDRISMNPEHLIGDAKRYATELASSYAPGSPRMDVPAGGESAYSPILAEIASMLGAGAITEHDFMVMEKLAHVMSGGRVPAGTLLSEQALFDLEREAFLSLCGMPKTQDRIEYMLNTGKPLRN